MSFYSHVLFNSRIKYNMVEIKFLGGANEVGRAAFLIDSGIEKFLLEYGLNVQQYLIPQQPPTSLDGMFVSHAHLDHLGMLPELYNRGFNQSTYLTKTTKDLSRLLLYDAIKVQTMQGKTPYFLPTDIEKFEKYAEILDFKQKIKIGEAHAELRDAGHIPGSSMILLETAGKRILYTGDAKFSETTLMNKADTHFKDIDVLLVEATYTYKNHPDRKKLGEQLREHVQEVVFNDGVVVLPAFAVGRTQELLTLVWDLGFPVFIDGMGGTATQLILDNPDSVKDHDLLKKAFGRAKIVDPKHRRDIVKNPCIIITTSGMLTGGPINNYIRSLYKREDCSLVMTGYQVEGTPGRMLMDKKTINIDGAQIEPKMQINFMDFSAHAGRDELFGFIEKVNPGKIIPVHGDSIPDFVEELKSKGQNAVLAKNGETIKI